MNLDELNERLEKLQRSLSEAPKGLVDFESRMQTATKTISRALEVLKGANPKKYQQVVKAAGDAMSHIKRAQNMARK